MKKGIILITLLILLINISGKATNQIIIPEDSIRYRIVANSDSKMDQKAKIAVRNALEDILNPLMLSSKTKKEMRQRISFITPLLSERVKATLKSQGVNTSYQIQYGMNDFPQKEYQGVTYQAGKYESLVVTIGKGEGANFWCILFPPLCLLEGEKQEDKKIEYTSFIQEILESIFQSR